MIRFIAAIDSLRGMADDSGIPWNLPTDSAHYKKTVTQSGKILMGYGTYTNHQETLQPNTIEYVAVRHFKPLRAGFECISDVDTFLKQNELVWVLGGSKLFESLIDQADELYITQVCGDFGCTKFFPAFESGFTLVKRSPIREENGIEFQYQVWKSKSRTGLQKPEQFNTGSAG